MKPVALLPFVVCALAHTGHAQVHVDSITLSIESRNIWRGFARGGATLRSDLAVALLGYPSTTVGAYGLTLDVTGWTGLSGLARSADRYVSTLEVLRKLGTSREEPPLHVSLGVSGYYLPDAPHGARTTSELVAGVSGGRVPFWPQERRPHYYIEGAHDVDQTHVTWLRAGLVLDYELMPLMIRGVPAWLFIDLSGSSSDDQCAGDDCTTMILHAWRAAARIKWDSDQLRMMSRDVNLRVALYGGGLWPRASIGPDVGFVGGLFAVVF